jgi:hypothetical protein
MEMVKTTIRLPKKLSQKVKIKAVKDETTFQAILIAAITEYIK